MREAGDTAQQFRALAALVENADSVPNTHKVVQTICNSSSGGVFWPLRMQDMHMVHLYTCRQIIYIHKNFKTKQSSVSEIAGGL